MSETREREVRRRLPALLLLVLLLAVALFLIAVATISVASPGPPLTQILSAPPDPSSSRTATFTFTNVFAVERFECSLDGAPYTHCGTERPRSTTYVGLAEGRHMFRVRAVSREAVGAASTHEWTIELDTSPPASRPPPRPDDGSADQPVDGAPPKGTDAGGDPDSHGLSISGEATRDELLFPGGAPVAVPLRVENPNGVAIRVIALAARIDAGSLPPGCRASWFRVTQSNVSSANPLTVPARGSVTLPRGSITAPRLRMLDDGNQDACKRATLRLEYAGQARS